MRKLIGVAMLLCVTSMFAFAGEKPLPEVYAGYQFTSTDGGWHANGWNTAANMYIWKNVGITGDLGSAYKSGTSLYTYTVGPMVSAPKGNFSPFAHALFGGAHGSTAGIGDSGMAMLFGGGVDFGKKRLVFRAVQFDWMVLRFNGVSDKNNMRVNTGLLYRF